MGGNIVGALACENTLQMKGRQKIRLTQLYMKREKSQH